MTFKRNDIVTLNPGDYEDWMRLTVGKQYTVVRASDPSGLTFVITDEGDEEGFFTERFKQVHKATTPMNELSPQCATIVKHLKRAGSITQREALMDHSVQSLTKRVSELRRNGYTIKSEPKAHPITGQRYMRYSLAA